MNYIINSSRHLYKRIKGGHPRSVKIKFNIFGSILSKGGSLLIHILLVPILIRYLNATNYGIWLTLTSILSWCNLLDIGLGDGLRNRFAEALAKGESYAAKSVISTTYISILFIISTFFIIFIIINPFISWTFIVNAERGIESELNQLTFCLFLLFSIRFILNLIKSILMADQRVSLINFLNVIGNTISLLLMLIIIRCYPDDSLLNVGIILYGTPILVLFLASIYLFNTDYKEFIPSFRYFRIDQVRDLTTLGFKFFFLQITAIILFSTDNLIISQLFNPAEVTKYNIAQKYFYLGLNIFTVFAIPFLPAYADAYFKEDIKWIANAKKKLIFIWRIFSLILIIMFIFSNNIYEVWIGNEIQIPMLLSLLMALSVIIHMWNSIYLPLINGIGKIKLQIYLSIFSFLFNIPLSIFFAKYLNLGSAGVIMATAICVGFSSFFYCLQFNKIISGTARGIWND